MRYLRFAGQRMLFLIPILIGLVSLTFALGNIIPSDPVRVAVGPKASQETVDKVRAQFGLNKPLPEQFIMYVAGLLKGDLGQSLVTRRPVVEDLKRKIPATAELALAATLIAVPVGLVLGTVAAVHRGRFADHLSRLMAVGGVSSPDFLTGLALQLIVGSALGLLPITGRGAGQADLAHVTGLYVVDSLLTGNSAAFVSSLKHLILPATTLALPFMATVTRLTRSGMLDILNRDYILNARVAAGLPEGLVVYKYALKNALVATTSQIGLTFGWLLGGAVIVENVFDWPGLGLYVVSAALYQDLRPILGTTLVAGVLFVTVNMLTDLFYAVLDPRITV